MSNNEKRIIRCSVCGAEDISAPMSCPSDLLRVTAKKHLKFSAIARACLHCGHIMIFATREDLTKAFSLSPKTIGELPDKAEKALDGMLPDRDADEALKDLEKLKVNEKVLRGLKGTATIADEALTDLHNAPDPISEEEAWNDGLSDKTPGEALKKLHGTNEDD